MIPVILTIAGSDSGAGAGIQADLKSIAANGGYGVSALTSVTAQNTLGVRSVHHMSASAVADQVDALFEDFPIAAAKTGHARRRGARPRSCPPAGRRTGHPTSSSIRS
ncbi:MAG: bifunctional hydroxymethylpyrimidine kinase/phosphomethylpyrimidine kinase [Dehalococcoidia bacterium]|nr:bifunctional hydroxymethylpyrimidine kinase/phosphomethylpyrimidine kinase [Dehalococcoidia bacterium]